MSCFLVLSSPRLLDLGHAAATLCSFSVAWGSHTSGKALAPGKERTQKCLVFLLILFLGFITPVCTPQGHLPSKVGGPQVVP